MLREKLCVTFHFHLDPDTCDVNPWGLESWRTTMIKTIRRDHLLSRLKAGLDRFLSRRRREDVVVPDRPMPAYDRVFEILGDPTRRSEGPGKEA